MLFHPRIRPQSVTIVLAGYEDFQVGHGWYPAFLLLIAFNPQSSGRLDAPPACDLVSQDLSIPTNLCPGLPSLPG
jgi:hypothetical protein